MGDRAIGLDTKPASLPKSIYQQGVGESFEQHARYSMRCPWQLFRKNEAQCNKVYAREESGLDTIGNVIGGKTV